ACADAPKVTLVARRLYGGAITVMAPKALGASTCLAWSDAKVSPHGPRPLSRWWRLDAVPADTPDELEKALSQGVVDRTIAPRDTRAALIDALAR
nr:carboxyl transferase domain-containing protein [Alphaproteobacteria bacterium]